MTATSASIAIACVTGSSPAASGRGSPARSWSAAGSPRCFPWTPRGTVSCSSSSSAPGAWAAGREPWLLECVAGVMEPGETPEALARREALEEAGCIVTDLVPIATFLTSPVCDHRDGAPVLRAGGQ